ncbi:LytR C-terminal domain-containing protein [Cellulomonas sp. RIT-PI-Y]|uniref:LytR C-terminal domain-containing protein n=1 Tax=Cellulomonas sp. RIT-PI-Y TaxID=3035297 RepID=UPI0021D9E7D7|nr:LytR C-terminal domain-containing protein [Cellulomonas sp. RIT-PI-Y]
MAVSAFGAAAVYTGSLSLPFLSHAIASPAPTGLAAANSPCPPEGAVPVAYGEITVNVYNGTNRPGLAGETSTSLSGRGFVIGVQGNASDRGYSGSQEGTALIQFGAQGAAQAYTVAAQFDSPRLVLDDRQDASVDVVVGTAYNALVAAGDVVLTADQPFASPEGCIPMDQVTVVAQPVAPEPTEDPAADPAAVDPAAEG